MAPHKERHAVYHRERRSTNAWQAFASYRQSFASSCARRPGAAVRANAVLVQIARRLFEDGVASLIVLAIHRLHRRADQMFLDTVFERAGINCKRRVDGLRSPVYVLGGVREAHDERRRDDAVPDQLLKEQRSKCLGWLAVAVCSDVLQIT